MYGDKKFDFTGLPQLSIATTPQTVDKVSMSSHSHRHYFFYESSFRHSINGIHEEKEEAQNARQ